MLPTLTREQVESYERNGYLIVPGFASREETARLREVAWKYARDLPAAEVFTTKEQTRRTGDKFMDSALGIASFLEEEAVAENGELKVPKDEAINKIGHALHEMDAEVQKFTAGCGGVATSLGMEVPLVVQSMFIFKQPRIGGEVREHRDSTFLWTDPPSCMAYWIALEDATLTNGCLWAVPGSHRDPVEQRFVRSKEAGKPPFVQGDPPRGYDESAWVPLPVDQGDLVLIHGSVYHRSASNRSADTRLVYTFHVIEGAGGDTWSPQNWLQRPKSMPFLSFKQLETEVDS